MKVLRDHMQISSLNLKCIGKEGKIARKLGLGLHLHSQRMNASTESSGKTVRICWLV